jgi:hypothetical protein
VPPGLRFPVAVATKRPVAADRVTERELLVPDPTRSVVVLPGQRAAVALLTKRPLDADRLTDLAIGHLLVIVTCCHPYYLEATVSVLDADLTGRLVRGSRPIEPLTCQVLFDLSRLGIGVVPLLSPKLSGLYGRWPRRPQSDWRWRGERCAA